LWRGLDVQPVTLNPEVPNLLCAIPRFVTRNVDLNDDPISLSSVFSGIGKHRLKCSHSIFVGLWCFSTFRCLNDNPAACGG
jgi:hypothetical protein